VEADSLPVTESHVTATQNAKVEAEASSGNVREIGTTKQGVFGEMSTILDTEIGVFQQNGIIEAEASCRPVCTQPNRRVRKASRSADNPATIRVT
jgi:hypothetical protein